jgi:GDP-D-mannose 3', 5'-epimerase
MASRGKVLVTGAGGFIGCHLVTYLKRQGYWVRGADLKYPDFSSHNADDFLLLDLRRQDACLEATRDIDEVYALASDTGGSGFLSSRKASTTHNNVLIGLHTLEAARTRHIKRFLYASSISVANNPSQDLSSIISASTDSDFLVRQQTAKAEQQLGEYLCFQYGVDHDLETRIVRLPNVFGPFSPWEGGRERAPAALCRKIALAKLTSYSDIEIWGDGQQTRTFCYIDDCVSALHQAMRSSYPISAILGGSPPFSINQIADIIIQIAGIQVQVSKRYLHDLGNREQFIPHETNLPLVVGPEPLTSIDQGLANTYTWIEERVRVHLFNLKHS